ncbi:MAG: glycosyltransferase family 2 protein [Gallionella sp.]
MLNSVEKRFAYLSSGTNSRTALSETGTGRPPPEASPGIAPPEIDDVPPDPETIPGVALSKIDSGQPSPGISLVAGCMNREENLLRVIDSWLATTADEIIVVDWSSSREVWPLLAPYADPRLKVVRIDGEKRWVASLALNAGLRFASREVVFRLDCDIELKPDFLEQNIFRAGEFRRGFWKSGLEAGGEGQQYIHGTFGAYKADLRNANYYNETIATYGWEDSELYVRLAHNYGLAGQLINPYTLRHIEQAEEQRLENQDASRSRFLGQFEPTVFESEKNRFYTTIEGTWGAYSFSQDYKLLQIEDNFFRGRRTTASPTRNLSTERLSEIFAARQLAVSATATMPYLGQAADIGIELARVLRDAHFAGRSMDLADRIYAGRGVFFFRCEDDVCRNALPRTIDVLCRHYPVFEQALIMVEDTLEPAFANGASAVGRNILFAAPSALAALESRSGAHHIASTASLVEQLTAGSDKAASLSISVDSLVDAVILKAAQVREKLGGQYESPQQRLPDACLVTSLYDEHNLLRLPEYLACVVLNAEIFERIVIYYESSSGLLAAVLREIVDRISIAPGRLLIIPYQKRPTFEELFSARTLFPAGTIIAVANADIAFDASFAKVAALDLTKTIAILSRRDISVDGTQARLIRLDNGSPNTFSADVWIFSTPFQADFFLDYPIGSFHCDSFINYQISTSSRYEVVNPCLEVNAYHLHDDRFNSSAEKHQRDFEAIQELYRRESERNGGADPIRGVAWSTIGTANLLPHSARLQTWRPKAIFLRLGQCAEVTFGHLVLLHWLLADVLHEINDAVVHICLKKSDLESPLGRLLALHLTHFAFGYVSLDLDESFDAESPSAAGVMVRRATFADLEEWLTESGRENIYSFIAWPQVAGIKLLLCEVGGEFATEATLRLLDHPFVASRIMPDLIALFNALSNYSGEKNLLAPYVVPHIKPAPGMDRRSAGKHHQPAVSFVTSLFRGGAFLNGYLENVLAAAQQAEGEVIIIDVNPDDADERVVRDFLESHPVARDYITYTHLDHDPGLYACWRLAIDSSRAELITNANIDDRRCQFHTARLVQLLNQHPEMAGACGSISCVRANGEAGWFSLDQNELWFYGEGISEIGFSDLYRTNEHGEVMSRDVMHCMPVWRKSLHSRYGYFDEDSYGTSADWAFWLKCSKAGEKFLFDEGAFGRYYLNPDSHNRRNDPEGLKERRIIKDLIGIEQVEIYKQ